MSLSESKERFKDRSYSVASPVRKTQLIQEVSLSYSAPYTSIAKVCEQDFILPLPPHSVESVYDKKEQIRSYSPSTDLPLLTKNSSFDSIEHFLKTAHKKKEFSDKTEFIPYFSAQSAVRSGNLTPTPITTPRTTPIATPTRRVGSALSQNRILSDSNTFEEFTTITTSNHSAKEKHFNAEMPTVNTLTKQFEIGSRQEKTTPLRQRKHAFTYGNIEETAKPKSRIVVIDKSDKIYKSATNRSAIVYSPSSILTTTIVDIEPAKYRQQTEEYKIHEEYFIKSQQREPTPQNTYQREEHNQNRFDDKVHKTSQRSFSAAEQRRDIEVPVDTSPIDVVRNVINRWETRIQEVTTTRSHTADSQSRSVSRVDMNDNGLISEKEKIIVHQTTKTPVENIIHSSAALNLNAQEARESSTVVKTHQEMEKNNLEQNVEPELDVITTQKSDSVYSPILQETVLSPSLIPTPSPTTEIFDKLSQTSEIQTTTDVTVDSITEMKEHRLEEKIGRVINTTSVGKDNFMQIEEAKKTIETEEHKLEMPTLRLLTVVQPGEKVEITHNDSHEQYYNSMERDYRIKSYEEWSTTRKVRDRSQPSDRPPTSYSSYSDRSKSIDRAYERNIFGSGLSRAYSEGRGLASGAYTSGFGGGLVSGISSAGAICTTQIRDAREREKREIGLLNDRLADYIEKVRFLEAQNQCLSHDIDILRRGFSGGGHVSGLFDTEISQAKRILEQTIAGRATFDRDIAALSSDIEAIRKKWIDSVNAIKAHREDHDIDLDRLAKIEAEISLFKRKIRIVEEDVIRIRRENDGIYNEIARIKQLTHNEIALKNERSLNVQDLLQRIKLLQTENNSRIEQELVFIRRDTTAENRDYFRHELQAAIRDIRADYEAISIRNRNDIEVWYREQIRKIQTESTRVNPDLYKEELTSIRTTVTNVKSRLAEVEGRNFFLEKLIEDLRNNEESKLYEISLAEKDAQIARLREQCTELSIQMERLCDNEISLRAEIERYRILLNGANVTTYVSNTHPAVSGISVGGNIGTTRVISETTRTHSSSNTSYTGVPASRSGYTVGGNIGGISVGGTIGQSGASAHVTRGAAGSVASLISDKRPDRVHDEKGVDAFGRSYHSWYLGTISINQVTPSYIELKNICKIRRVDVGGFRIEQSRNGHLLGSAQIDVPLILDPQEVVRFNHRHGKYLGQFFMDVDAFDNSTEARTSMFNYTEPEQERAWFVYLD